MPDTPRILPFNKREPVPSRQEGEVKYALYPLGSEDVIISVATLEVVLYALRQGTDSERAQVADTLRQMYAATVTDKRP